MCYSVTVLMSTYNGEKYIREQLDSIFEQKNVNVELVVRDDGSSDQTINIINEYAKKYPISLYTENNIGYAKSFMTLVSLAKHHKSDFYAFCDQDDVWKEDKLITAINKLNGLNNDNTLYLSQAIIVDSNLNRLNSKFHSRKVELGAVLQHNYAIGCTMVFNDHLRDLLDINLDKQMLKCGHDSWVYLVALAIGAGVIFDTDGYVYYRQHGNNASGKIMSIRQGIRAINKILFRWKHTRSDIAKKLLDSYDKYIADENIELLKFASYRPKNIKQKIKFITDERMHSDYFMVDFLYGIAVILDLF